MKTLTPRLRPRRPWPYQLLRWLGALPVLAALLLARPAQAQTDVRVTVLVLPPYSTHLADYVDQPNRLVVTLTNTTRSPLSLQLAGTLSGDNGVRVQTNPQARSPRPVVLNALQTRTLDRDELGQLFDESQLQYAGVTAQQVVRGNGLPEGTYTLCVRALDYNTLRPVSAENPLGCSRGFLLRSLEPPIIVRPSADEVVATRSPQNILFTWTRPAGAAPGTEYELRIVEMSDARRNPNDAFLAGTVPPLFERTVVGVTTLLYGPAEPALLPGRRYAFAVTARDLQGRAAFRNNGRSEVSTFVYGALPAGSSAPVAAASPAAPVKGPKKADLSTPKLPTTLVRGRLLWGWRKSEEGSLVLPQQPALGIDVEGTAFAALNDPSAGTGAAAALNSALKGAGKSPGATGPGSSGGKTTTANAPGSGSGGGSAGGGTTGLLSAVTTAATGGANAPLLAQTTAISGGGQTSGVTVSGAQVVNGQVGGANSSSVNDLPTIGAAPAAQLPGILGSSRYPLAFQKIKLVFDYRRIPKGQLGWNDPALNAEQHEVMGLGTTDADGNFAVSILAGFELSGGLPQLIKGNKTYAVSRLRVEVDNPHFRGEPVGYELKPGKDGGFELGETLCLANSYRLKIQVQEAGNKPATGPVQVQLMRLGSWYGQQHRSYARLEGQLPADNRPSFTLDNPNSAEKGQFIIITQAAKAEQNFVRLLANVTGPADHYLLTLRAEGYQDFTTTLGVQPAADGDLSSVVTVTKTYTLNRTPPQVRGRVLRKNDNSPVPGISIRLARTRAGTGKVYTTQTDKDGRFIISTVGPTSVPMTLEVLPGPGVQKGWKEENIKLDKTGPAGIVLRDPILIDATLHPVAGRVSSDQGGSVAQAHLHWKSGGAPFQTDAQGRFLTTHQAGADTLVIGKLGFRELRVGVWVNGSGLTNPKTGKKGSDNFLVLDGSASGKQLKNVANDLSKTFGKGSSLQVEGAAPFQLPGAGLPAGGMAPGGLNPGAGNGGLGNAGSPGKNGNNGNAGGSSDGTVLLGSVSNSQYLGGSLADHNALLGYLQGAAAGNPVGDGQDLGELTLVKLVGRLRVTVLDSATAQPLAGATVTFPDATPALSLSTGADGKAQFDKAPGGPVSLRISGPAEGTVAYVPALQDVAVALDGAVTELSVRLASGARVQGSVTTGGQPVAGATVRVLGRPDLQVQTAANGQYALLGVPKGSWTLEAGKSGLVGQSQTQTFKPGQTATVDFALSGAGFAIDKLLGFPIEVKTLTLGADTVLTGAFVNLPNNALFTAAAGTRLEFANVAVRLGKTGLLRPKNQDYVLTDAPELTLTAFKFLPVRIAEPAGLRVQMQPGNPGKGQLAGAVEINYGALGQDLGWAWQAGTKTYLSEAPGTGALPPLPVLTSDGNLPLPSLHLRAPGKAAGLALYGFAATIDLTKSTVAADGLHLAGAVSLKDVPGLSAASISVTDLWIGTGGEVKTATLGLTPPVTVAVAGFGFTLTGGSLTEAGFKLSGSVSVKVPGSAGSTVSFTDLAIGSGQLYGGQFVLPSAGLDVFGLAKFRPVSGSPLAFGTLPGGGPAFFSGGARTTLPLISKELSIESFTVRSDGKFSAQVPVDYDARFAGLCTLHLTGVKFNTIGEVGIDVLGDVRLDLAALNVKAEMGNLRYRPGKSPSLDNVGLHVPIGVGELGGAVSFKNNGFGGNLGLSIVSVMNVKAGFNYQKVGADVQFDAKIMAGIPPVPIGPGLALSSIGGGLGYGGGKLKKVSVSGVVSVVGFESGLALNPINVTVTPGPVIVGTANLTVIGQTMANAALTLDFPNSLASVQIKTDYNPLPAVGTASAGGIVVVSGKGGDSYWMLGLGAQAKLLGLLDVNSNLLVAQNLNVAQHPEYGYFTSFVDPAFLSGGTTVNGAHLQGVSHIGRHENDAFYKCFWEACGKIWYYNDAETKLNFNFEARKYGLSIASGWGGGAALTVAGESIAGASVGANGALSGLYDAGPGWYINGSVGAYLTGWLGSCGAACSNKICWGGCFDPCPIWDCEICPIPVGVKVCVHPSLKVDYSSNSGLSMGLDL